MFRNSNPYGGSRVAFKCRLALLALAVLISNGCANNQSLLLYRLPYADGDDVRVWQDHVTHSPINRVDLKGVNGSSPYPIVAAHTGVVRIIVDNLSQNCCGGTCGNNYVWLEHAGGEWTKYSHLATGSVTGDAGLSVGDVVIAGTLLGYESNIGRACGAGNGVHLHFEVGVPDDPSNPLIPGNIGLLAGENRIPRFCGVPGQLVEQNQVYEASRCGLLVSCIQSKESPSTEGNCEEGLADEVCVQEINNVALTSTYIRGEDFESSSVKIDLDWCATPDCDPSATTGRAIHVVVVPDGPGDPTHFVANCRNRKVLETVHNVAEIIIQEAPNLGEDNAACNGNTVPSAFAKWEICEVSSLLAP